MNWMNLCWILDEKWREPAASSSSSASTSLFAVILLLLVIRGLPRLPSHLFIRDPPSALSLFIRSPFPRHSHTCAFFFLAFIFLRRTFLTWRYKRSTNHATDRPTNRLSRIMENIALAGPIFNYYVMLERFRFTWCWALKTQKQR